MSTTMLNRYSRPRLLFLIGCAVLPITALIYLYYGSYYAPAAAGSKWLGFLRPLPDDTNISQTGSQDAWLPTAAPGVQDDVEDPSILHPERHIFRDPTTIHMTWNVTMEQRAPDGVMRPVYLINGEWSRSLASASTVHL
jgi:hypothetical protein